MSKVEQFKPTRHTVCLLASGKLVPVLRLGRRLYCGELLSMLNQHGYGGTVWSAMDIATLRYNANFKGSDHGNGH